MSVITYTTIDTLQLWLQQFHGNDSDDLTALLKHLSHHVRDEKLYVSHQQCVDVVSTLVFWFICESLLFRLL